MPKTEKTTIGKPAPASEEQSNVVSLGVFPIANSSEKGNSNGRPVLENFSVNFDEAIVHNAIKVESLDSCSESKVSTPQVISEVVFSENNMDEFNRQEPEGPNNGRDGIGVEILKVPNCSRGEAQSMLPDAGFASNVDGTEFRSGRTISLTAMHNTTQNSLVGTQKPSLIVMFCSC